MVREVCHRHVLMKGVASKACTCYLRRTFWILQMQNLTIMNQVSQLLIFLRLLLIQTHIFFTFPWYCLFYITLINRFKQRNNKKSILHLVVTLVTYCIVLFTFQRVIWFTRLHSSGGACSRSMLRRGRVSSTSLSSPPTQKPSGVSTALKVLCRKTTLHK